VCRELTVSCIDVLLKYVALRLFDSNTSVQLKALELLAAVLQTAHAAVYQLTEHEAALILPVLVAKTAEKEMVQRGVRAALRAMCNTYASSRIFGALMDGTKAKSARTRAAALDVCLAVL
jgi:cytoskeleton-associated protein 5